MEQTKRQRYKLLAAQLKNERASFEPQWRDLNDYIAPTRGRFYVGEGNKGDRRNLKIIDSTASYSADVLAAGMMSGLTSPARPWFRLSHPTPEISEAGMVKEYLHVVTQNMTQVFLKSNLYATLSSLYYDAGVFGTAAMLVEPHRENVIHTTLIPLGSYWIAKGAEGKVNVFYREYRMTLRQMVEQFAPKGSDGAPDLSNFSTRAQQAYKAKRYEDWFEVCHMIEPNEKYRPGALLATEKQFHSCYYEMSCDDDKYLRESGYDYFPVLVLRWALAGEDVYGTNCPGMMCIGDVKQLQHGEKRAMQGIDKQISPPMKTHVSLKNSKVSYLPGDHTWVDDEAVSKATEPMYQVNLNLRELDQRQEMCRQRIKLAFKENLFMAISSLPDRQRTAMEIGERREERLIGMGPTLERANNDVLNELIDITFLEMSNPMRNLVPPPPEEIAGADLKVEYISIMHAAQKSTAIAGLEKLASGIAAMAPIAPDIMDKLDTDQLVDELGEALGVSPRVIRSDEKVEELRAAKAQQMQQQQMAERVPMAAQTAKTLSETGMDGDTALTKVMEMAQAGNITQ